MFPHSSQEAAVQTQLVLAEGCVCMLRLSFSPFAAAAVAVEESHGVRASDDPILTQLYHIVKKQRNVSPIVISLFETKRRADAVRNMWVMISLLH